MTVRTRLSDLPREEIKRRRIEAHQELLDESLEQYAREHNDVELAKRNGFDLTQPPSWELEDQDES